MDNAGIFGKVKSLVEKITTIIFITTILLGCKYINLNEDTEIAKETKTQITKEVITERLITKGVKIAEINTNAKPNPNLLILKMVRGYAPPKFKLNENDVTFPELVTTLNNIFIERGRNGVFAEGTNEVYKRITLTATDSDIALYNKENVSVEDFEKLIDDLRKEKFDQIYLTFSELPTLKLSDIQKPTNQSSNTTSRRPPKKIPGGVLNDKAINLIQPTYPPAAKAVRASGMVAVNVEVDEQGNVISAFAASGHPLLLAVAEEAAKASTFSPAIFKGQRFKMSGTVVYNFSPPK